MKGYKDGNYTEVNFFRNSNWETEYRTKFWRFYEI